MSTVFLDVTPYSVVGVVQRFEGTDWFHLQGEKLICVLLYEP
jgi:hypothetical protein